jgi:hypothetical protein
VEIARGRSYASVLVIRRRKMSLCEALHGRAAMAGVGAPWPAMGVLTEEGREGGAARGRHGEVGRHGEGCYGGVVGGTMGLQPLFGLLLYMRRKEEGEEKRREEKKKKRKEKKREKNMEIFQT